MVGGLAPFGLSERGCGVVQNSNVVFFFMCLKALSCLGRFTTSASLE